MTGRKRLFRAILISQIIWMFTSCHVGNQEDSDSDFILLAGENHEILEENIVNRMAAINVNKNVGNMIL